MFQKAELKCGYWVLEVWVLVFLKCGYWVLPIICEGSGREALCIKRKGRKEERKKRLCVECFAAWRKW